MKEDNKKTGERTPSLQKGKEERDDKGGGEGGEDIGSGMEKGVIFSL